MLMKVVSVRDAKVETFSQPFFYVTVGQAIRSFADEVARDGSDFAKHPEDFALFLLGVYDDQKGSFTSLPQPEQIALALDHVKV